VPTLPRTSQSLVEVVVVARPGRKFLRGDYRATPKAARVNGESVGEDEILPEEFAETVDKFSLSLTNKDFRISLGMSTVTFSLPVC
jgi:hypothetical protein